MTTPTLLEAARMAREALNADNSKLWPSSKRTDAIAALDAAIAEAERAEPVAFANKENLASATEPDSVVPLIAWASGGVLDDRWFDVPLYIHPKEQPKPLTDEEIDDIWNEHIADLGEQALIDSFRSAARAIEAAVRKT